MKNLARLFAVVHSISGLVLLLFSGWFIAACAIAGYDYAEINFNYLLPAVIIRALALTRIASGYAQMWEGHRALLSEVKLLRIRLFSRLKNRVIIRRSEGTEALAKHSENIASVNMAWTVHNLGAFCAVIIATIALFIWLPKVLWLWGIFIVCVLIIFIIGFNKIVSNAKKIMRLNDEFRHHSEHHLSSASLWHLRQNLSHTDRNEGFTLSQQQHSIAERMLWWVQAVGYLTLIGLLYSQAYQGRAVLLIFILLLLSAKDWLGQMIRSQTAYADYKESRQTFDSLPVQRLVSADIQPQPITQLVLRNFTATDRRVQCITTTLNSGHILLLKGDSGIGKSSLLQAIAGLLPHSGDKIVNDEVIGVGFIQQWYYAEQSPSVLSANLADNLRLAKPDATDSELLQALKFADLSYLDNLNEWLGTEGRQLSGGELKRMTIARAYLFDAELYLLDEPFEGLDITQQSQMAISINQLAEQSPVIIASHIVPKELNCQTLSLLSS
ncbi:MAG: ATP-binding cassette domain-containing protein [Gammaproteobacteria bacterium]|nr:ATP-binding cassette domain-containing protein [Gammaproteobacteria bacterium]